MKPALDLEIREWLARYLVEEISYEDFLAWFVPSSWNVGQSANQAVIDLVYEIELWLAEFSNDIWSEQELKQKLRPLVENYRVNLVADSSISSASDIKIERWFFPTCPFGIRHVMASG
ncbi:MAG: hypothetical protein JRI66_03755 [Deltaproteobacteria bacterium]|nr:hypothetical protein [Deltaproteobacteria bacterium]